MHRIVRLGPVVLLLLVVGCSDSAGPISFSLNRMRWEKANLHDYGYIGRRICDCPNSGVETFVVVLSDTVFSATVASTRVEVPKDGWQTVDQLFDSVARLLADDSWSVTVEYDRTLGYPTLIHASCSAADCVFGIRTRNVGELPSLAAGD